MHPKHIQILGGKGDACTKTDAMCASSRSPQAINGAMQIVGNRTANIK